MLALRQRHAANGVLYIQQQHRGEGWGPATPDASPPSGCVRSLEDSLTHRPDLLAKGRGGTLVRPRPRSLGASRSSVLCDAVDVGMVQRVRYRRR